MFRNQGVVEWATNQKNGAWRGMQGVPTVAPLLFRICLVEMNSTISVTWRLIALALVHKLLGHGSADASSSMEG